jgi:hypothetical protein
MSDGENKALPSAPDPAPEPVGIGKPPVGKLKPEQFSWHRTLSSAVATIRRECGPIERVAADRMARCFRSMLLPRRPPGRKPSREVAIAASLRRKDVQWRVIYPKALAGYASMPFYERSYRCYNLRRAVAACLKRQRLRERKRRQDESPHRNV